MATSARLPTTAASILTSTSYLISFLAIGGGIYGLRDPIAFSSTLGIPATSPALPFVSFAAARNLGSGISLLALLYSGQKKSAGTIMLCGVTVAMADAWICSNFGATEGKAMAHAVMGVIVGVLGGECIMLVHRSKEVDSELMR